MSVRKIRVEGNCSLKVRKRRFKVSLLPENVAQEVVSVCVFLIRLQRCGELFLRSIQVAFSRYLLRAFIELIPRTGARRNGFPCRRALLLQRLTQPVVRFL